MTWSSTTASYRRPSFKDSREHARDRLMGFWTLAYVVLFSHLWFDRIAVVAQELDSKAPSASMTDTATRIPVAGAVPRDAFFSMHMLDEDSRKRSEDLLWKALDSEALYTLAGSIKPISEGFWGGYFPVAPPDLSELNRVREALRAWCVPGLYHADVLVYESLQFGQRYASAYVANLPSLQKLIERESDFFSRWGITSDSSPQEVMMAIERSRQPDDRWRGFGLVFGYPKPAVDFFVAAGMHQRSTGEFIERDFRQLPTYSHRNGRFVYAVSKLSPWSSEDLQLQRASARLISEYKRIRPRYATARQSPSELLREWMDDGTEMCHPDYLAAKLAAIPDAEVDAEIASWSAPESRAPSVYPNHIRWVLSEEQFVSVHRALSFMDSFSASDEGFPFFKPIERGSQTLCLWGKDTYLELAGPNNRLEEPVGKFELFLSVEKSGQLNIVANSLLKNSPEQLVRSREQWELSDSNKVTAHSMLRRDHANKESFGWAILETDAMALESLLGRKPSDAELLTRSDLLESRFDKSRLLKNFTSITLSAPRDAADLLRTDLGELGWRIEDFDARTWSARGPDFRVMVLGQSNSSVIRLLSIGFDTNPGTQQETVHAIGQSIEVVFDGKSSGWIQIQPLTSTKSPR